MKTYNAIILLFILVSVFLGTIILSFSLHLIELNDLIFKLNEVYNNFQARITLGAGGAIFILLAFLLAQLTSASIEREKTIAFNNPSGQVTITLFAVEDLIRKIGQELPQVKELKPNVIATRKKGILVKIRLILKSETNIPEFTAHLQETVKNKIQEIFGIDEQIVVKIHVAKILTQQEKTRRKNEEFDVTSEEAELKVPFPRA